MRHSPIDSILIAAALLLLPPAGHADSAGSGSPASKGPGPSKSQTIQAETGGKRPSGEQPAKAAEKAREEKAESGQLERLDREKQAERERLERERQCIIKPVMTDAEIAKCKEVWR